MSHMRTLTTMEELARGLMAVRGLLRMGYRRSEFVCAVEFPGGSATFVNAELPSALSAALRFLFQHNPRTVAIEPVAPDPEGAKVGPAPTGTIIGQALPAHCFGCGFGEEVNQHYLPGSICPNCGGTRACTLPNCHEGNHNPCET